MFVDRGIWIDPCYPDSSSLGVIHENQFMSVRNGTTSMLSFVLIVRDLSLM